MKFEIMKIRTGKDRYESPFVELTLRTQDFTALALSKYQITETPIEVEILNEKNDG
jgi:hypothetical protein